MFSFVSALLRPRSAPASLRRLYGFRLSYCFRFADLLFHLRGNACDKRISFHIFDHDRPGPRHRTVADVDWSDKHRIGADMHVVADMRFMLVLAVIVASDRSSADIRVLADCCITQISQMTSL